MPYQAPENLIELLSRLGLATRQQVERVAGRVKWLAGELPLFESVWVDALAQEQVLTPFQAAELNAGRGELLQIGPYLLQRSLASNGLGQWFIGKHGQTGSLARLLRAECKDVSAVRVLEQLQALIHDLHDLEHVGLALPREAGIVSGDSWVAADHVEGVCAADWLAHNGRLSPPAVLEIARQMAAALAVLESRGRLHCDLGARQAILTKAGQVVLPLPGVRAILRPAEGYTRLDLLPEGYDYLAPERIAAGTPPDVASEMFACGCLWWHLLCGRPPLSGGDALGKVRSAQEARIPDVRRFAAETPQVLIDAIVLCTQADPSRRPRSMIELSAKLGPADKAGRAALARCLKPPAVAARLQKRAGRKSPHPASDGSTWPLATAAAVMIGLGLWWLGHREVKLPLNEIKGTETVLSAKPAKQPVAATAAPAVDGQPQDLVLSGDRVQLDQLRLQPGQTVRSAPGRRTLVLVPPGGMAVDSENVRFENLDFAAAANTAAAIIRLRTECAAFHGCSFQGPAASTPTVAVDWQGSPSARREALNTGRLELTDCVFQQVAQGIQIGQVGAVRLAASNCLHLGPGAWIALTQSPAADEPCLIALSHCTIRGARSLLRIQTHGPDTIGEIQVKADNCAFSLLPQDGLLIAEASEGVNVFRCVRLTGQGSILSSDVPLALWHSEYGSPRKLADDEIEAAGLVRSRMTFAGDNLHLPAASRVVRWQAPLASTDPPGILEKPLYLP